MQQATTCYGLSQELPCFDAESCQARCRGVYQHITHLGPTLPPGVQLQEVLEGASAAERATVLAAMPPEGNAVREHYLHTAGGGLPGSCQACYVCNVQTPKPFCIMRACLICGEYCAATCCLRLFAVGLPRFCVKDVTACLERDVLDQKWHMSASPSSWDIYVLRQCSLQSMHCSTLLVEQCGGAKSLPCAGAVTAFRASLCSASAAPAAGRGRRLLGRWHHPALLCK